MRSVVRLCFTAALCVTAVSAKAQQQNPAAPSEVPPPASPAEAAPPSSTDAAAPVADAAAAPSSSTEAGKGDEEEAEIAHLGASKALPADVPPNPPKPDDLKNGVTWKGEYAMDKDGKPLLGPDGRVLPVLYSKKGKRLKTRVKTPKTHPIHIANGTLTVDGWTGKARLNYDISDLKFIYLSSPNVGTVIVSQNAFPGSTVQKDAFSGQTLTVQAGEHQLQLTSDEVLLGKKGEEAWVKFDPAYTSDPQYPVMGYGNKQAAPYEWPGALVVKQTGSVGAPPLPPSMRPKLAVPICIERGAQRCPSPSASQPAMVEASAP